MEESTKMKYLFVLVLLIIPAHAQDAGGPSIIFPKRTLEAIKGDAVELQCGVRGKHRNCAWEHAGGATVPVEDVLNEDNPLERYEKPSNSNDNQCGITIKKVEQEDEGAWTCKIFVRAKTLQQSVTLTVIDSTATRAPRKLDQQDDSTTPTESGYLQHDSTKIPVSENSYYEDEDYHQENNTSPDDYIADYDYLNSLEDNFPTIEPRYGKGGDGVETPNPTTESESEPDHSTTQGHGAKYPLDPELYPTNPFNQNDHHTDPYPHPYPHPTNPFNQNDHHTYPHPHLHPHPHPHQTESPAEHPVPENQVEPDGGSSALWISLIVILVILILLALCFWYFFCRTSQSHDIVQMEGGRKGVEMSPIVQENGDLETITEEQSTQLLTDVKVEVHNEQELDASQGKEDDKGISNKAFTDQEEIKKQDDKSQADQSDKSDQKDLSKDEDDNETIKEDTSDSNDSKSIESISSEGEKIEDKDVQDVSDESKDSDNKDDDNDAKLEKQAEDIKDDDKVNGVESKDKNHDGNFGDKATQDDGTVDDTQDSPTPKQVEGEDSPFQDAVFLNMHNGEVYEEEAKDKIDDDDDDDTKKE